MDSYNIIFKPSVQKDLRRLPATLIARVMKRINSLQIDPVPHHARKLSNHDQLYRLRVGDYRIVYEVNAQARQITIHYVRHRRDVYRSV